MSNINSRINLFYIINVYILESKSEKLAKNITLALYKNKFINYFLKILINYFKFKSIIFFSHNGNRIAIQRNY